LSRIRAALLALVGLISLASPLAAFAQPLDPQVVALQGGAVGSIRVEGNQRIEESTIRSYMLVRPGDPFDPEQLDRSLKTLYATGLFSDVALRREGNLLVVKVAENPIVNRIAFEGNKQLTDDALRPELQLRARAVFTPATAQADRQRLLNLYARHGRFSARVEPKIIELGQNRVDVVFEIEEGANTLTSRIAFVGNKAFSESKLGEVISSREAAWWRFLSVSDGYDPDRMNFDKEQLRKFYLSKGYADIQVTGATAELAPDRSSFFITFTIDEGGRYSVAKSEFNVTLKGLTAESLKSFVPFDTGDWYDGEALDRTIQAVSEDLQGRGFPFVEVKPRVQRHPEDHTIDVVIDVAEGPHVYVERIDILGNQRTKDNVIRREFRLAEGDPFNPALIRLSRQRIDDLQYFAKVDVQAQTGASADKMLLTTHLEEKATGSLSIGGGYSTDIGALVSFGLREKNLVGTGIDASFNTVLAQKQTTVSLSVTDPYFLDRNIAAGFDVYHIVQNNSILYDYREDRTGLTLRMGYAFSEHLRQQLSYSVVERNVYDVGSLASIYVSNAKGTTLLSQVGQSLTLDFRDSLIDPHKGWVARLATDYAGLGGDPNYVRAKFDTNYYIPLERFFGDPEWVLAISGGVGELFNLGRNEQIIDRFFLGGDNLRGFQTGGVGPHVTTGTNDSIGGRFIWTQSTELRFPLPLPADLGIIGRTFVDVGSLSQVKQLLDTSGAPVTFSDDSAPRVGAGVGISWKTPVGLINIDVAEPVVKKKYDQTQLFRLGFGTRF